MLFRELFENLPESSKGFVLGVRISRKFSVEPGSCMEIVKKVEEKFVKSLVFGEKNWTLRHSIYKKPVSTDFRALNFDFEMFLTIKILQNH